MAVYIWQKDAFKKFIEVESRGDKKMAETFIQHHREFGICSFWAFYQKWQEMYVLESEILDYDPDCGLDVDKNGAIYGFGGWNRYAVYNTGEMVFIEGLARSPHDIAWAKKVGFRMKWQQESRLIKFLKSNWLLIAVFAAYLLFGFFCFLYF